MSAQEQLSAIYRDLNSLGLMWEESTADVDRSAILRAVIATKRIGNSRPPKDASLHTKFGQTVYKTMQTGISFSTHPLVTTQRYHGCGDAENHFAHTITPTLDDCGAPPIVVTHKDTPVAIIKGLGEATAYVLRGSMQGLIERTIALPEYPIDPQFLKQDVPAHKVELTKLGDFSPLRYALPAIPPETMAVASYSIDYFRHDAMLACAQHLAEHARPIAGRVLREAMHDTAEYYGLSI